MQLYWILILFVSKNVSLNNKTIVSKMMMFHYMMIASNSLVPQKERVQGEREEEPGDRRKGDLRKGG